MDNNNNNYYQNSDQQPQYNNQQQQQQYYNQQQQYNNQQQSYYQPQQQNYYQPNQVPLEEPVSLGDWILTLIIMAIPCVNLIMMFVWGFGSGVKTSKKNYCRAMLVFLLIAVVFYLLIIALLGASVFGFLRAFS